MTFNTTSLPLPLRRALQLRRSLRVHEPSRRIGETKRCLIVTPEVSDLLDGRVRPPGGFPDPAADALIARYCASHLVAVSRKKNDLRPDLEQLEGFDEAWALCVRVPRPGWRLLGRFIEKNVFVALKAWDKHTLAGNYPQAVGEMNVIWDSLLQGQEPLRGALVGDYLSQVFRDVDEPIP